MQELLLVFILLLAVLTLLSALGGSLRFQEGFFEEEAGAVAVAAAEKQEPEGFEDEAKAGQHEPFEWDAESETFRAGRARRRSARREKFEDEKAKPAVAEPPAVDPQAEGFQGAAMEPMAANEEEGFIEAFENPAMFGGCATGTCAAF